MGRKEKKKQQTKNVFICPICCRVFPSTLFRPNRQICPRCEMAGKKEKPKNVMEKQKQYVV